MRSEKKILLFAYVDKYCGIENENFNFDTKRRFKIVRGYGLKDFEKYEIRRDSMEELKAFPGDFWGEKVSALTLLIGENGTGKTTLMRLVIKWLCKLAAGNIPKERGAFVLGINNENVLIAFSDSAFWTIGIETDLVVIQDIQKVRNLLADIAFVYYTDTMTDLELSDVLNVQEMKYLQDDSLLNRISKAMVCRDYFEDAKEILKRDDFARLMDLFFHSQIFEREETVFPIHYMKLTSLGMAKRECFDTIKPLLGNDDDLINILLYFWKHSFPDITNNTLFARHLMWSFFSGIVLSMLLWEHHIFKSSELRIPMLIKQVLISLNGKDQTKGCIALDIMFKDLYNYVHAQTFGTLFWREFDKEWGRQFLDKCIKYIDAVGNMEEALRVGGDSIWSLWENVFYSDTKVVWHLNLDVLNENMVQEWRIFWGIYSEFSHMMPNCRFDWKYASSGERNQSSLYKMLKLDVTEKHNIWYFLDEPDNTFHVAWKRKFIQEVINVCRRQKTKNFQLWISTHSPIMLSDVPKEAAILLKKDEVSGVKKQVMQKKNSFGQQIYTLFNDAFFMNEGIIGAFAEEKIGNIYQVLYEIEGRFKEKKKNTKICDAELAQYRQDLEECRVILECVDEPLLRGHLLLSYNRCNNLIKALD